MFGWSSSAGQIALVLLLLIIYEVIIHNREEGVSLGLLFSLFTHKALRPICDYYLLTLETCEDFFLEIFALETANGR